jgi:hypothetical protein
VEVRRIPQEIKEPEARKNNYTYLYRVLVFVYLCLIMKNKGTILLAILALGIITLASSCKKKCQQCVINTFTSDVDYFGNGLLISSYEEVVQDCDYDLGNNQSSEKVYKTLSPPSYIE